MHVALLTWALAGFEARTRSASHHTRNRSVPAITRRSERGDAPQNAFSFKKGSGFNEPSRCLTSICTLPSASSNSFLHAVDRPTPSSKSLRESSRARSPFSSCSTMVSSFLSDSSNDAMHLLRGGYVRIRQDAGNHFGGRVVAAKGGRHLHAFDHGAHRIQHLLRDQDALAPRGLGR